MPKQHSTKYACKAIGCTWEGYFPRAVVTSKKIDGIQVVKIINICPECGDKITDKNIIS